RLIVSGMEYALLTRTMPSFSAARAITGEVNTKAKRAADRMRRASMKASFFLVSFLGPILTQCLNDVKCCLALASIAKRYDADRVGSVLEKSSIELAPRGKSNPGARSGRHNKSLSGEGPDADQAPPRIIWSTLNN